MKSLSKIHLILVLLSISNIVKSQVTITEIKKIEEKVVSRPPIYDSLKNWESPSKLSDLKKYIGIQIYLPPQVNKKIGERTYSYKFRNFLFTLKPTITKSNRVSVRDSLTESGKRIKTYSKYYHPYYNDTLITNVFAPYHYFSEKDEFQVCSDSARISNYYYTILDVFYGKKLDSITIQMDKNFNDFVNKHSKKSLNKSYYDETIGENIEYIFLIKNNTTNEEMYYVKSFPNFIIVPYFVKIKKIFKNKTLVSIRGDYEVYDNRTVNKIEDYYGNEKIVQKKVQVKRLSKWTCTDVTLLAPSYNIKYILKNENNEEIAIDDISDIRNFSELSQYLKKEEERKIQTQQSIAKQKEENRLRDIKEKKAIEKHTSQCIILFGQKNGEIISQGKVGLNMTKEMCKYAWGIPLRTTKTIIEKVETEVWHYPYGYTLTFENELLKKIVE